MKQITIIAALFSLAPILPAQCYGLHPPGATGVVSIPSQGCNEISSTPNQPPFLSVNAAPSASTGGLFAFDWSRIPTYSTAPAIYQSYILVDLVQISPQQLPGTLSPNCSLTVAAGVLLHQSIVLVTSICVPVTLGILPPLPALQGLPFFAQGILWDLTQNTFAVSPPMSFQFQP